ncbi:MAG: hypothetical protein IT328_04065 [Caldilineaceae bacterium]|nr:hypothetical protein [Caldilineaceae bacterium]
MNTLINGEIKTSRENLPQSLKRDELFPRLIKVLKFASANLDQLDHYAKFWKDNTDPILFLVEKVIAETAILVFLVSRIPEPCDETRSLLVTLRHQLSMIVRSAQSRILLLRYPNFATQLGLAHIILTRLDEPDEEFDVLLRRAMTMGQVDSVPRVPFRYMDIRWVRALLFNTRPDFTDLLPLSIITSCAHPIYMTRSDAYALTHELMYITDFGDTPVPASLDLSRISDMIDAGLAWSTVSKDLDLIGELLFAATLLRQPWSSYSRFGWHLLVSVWDNLGFLPGPDFEGAVHSSLLGDEASSYIFRYTYHTNYVGGMLCALLLHNTEDDGRGMPSPSATNRIDLELIEACERAVSLALDFCEQQQLYLSSRHNQEIAQEQNSPTNYSRNLTEIKPLSANLVPTARFSLEVASALLPKWSDFYNRSEELWTEILHDAPLKSDELSLVLFDGILIRAARHYDLDVLASLLADMARHTLPVSNTFLEATAFLVHQQLPSGALGAHFVIPQNLESPHSISITASLAIHIVEILKRLTHGL